MRDNFVSILIPIRNESQYIERCLDGIRAQDYPMHRMEILVVDGISTDGTCQIVERYAAAHGLQNLRIIENPGKIVPIGMNLGLKQAQGNIIVRVDGHCVIAPDYIRLCVAHLQNDGVDGVGGPTDTIGETPVARVIAAAMSSTFGVGNSAFRTVSGKSMLVDTVPFPAYTREVIERAGPYDEELVRNQDDEYNYRIRNLGGKILLAGDVRSVYYSRGAYGKLWQQYYQYGFYKIRVLQKHPRQMSLRQFVPPGLVSGLIVSLVVGWVGGGAWWLVGSVVGGAYLMANLAASLITAASKGWRKLWGLPLAFALLHFGYGSGFLVGLLHFRKRWQG